MRMTDIKKPTRSPCGICGKRLAWLRSGLRSRRDAQYRKPANFESVKDTEIDLGVLVSLTAAAARSPTPEGPSFLEDARPDGGPRSNGPSGASRQNAAGARGQKYIVRVFRRLHSRQISEALDAFQRSVPGVQVEMHVMFYRINMLKT